MRKSSVTQFRKQLPFGLVLPMSSMLEISNQLTASTDTSLQIQRTKVLHERSICVNNPEYAIQMT